jgi:hypothetical protein
MPAAVSLSLTCLSSLAKSKCHHYLRVAPRTCPCQESLIVRNREDLAYRLILVSPFSCAPFRIVYSGRSRISLRGPQQLALSTGIVGHDTPQDV